MKFRKKPVEIEAMQLVAENCDAYEWAAGLVGRFDYTEVEFGMYPDQGVSIDPADGQVVIATLEGLMKANLGDWIIRGVEGELYPCKPSIFEATYEPVT